MKLERQLKAYRETMGEEALRRQLDPGRCESCGGLKPAGHKSGCPYWGGREPRRKEEQ